jgi:hypothetical protein
LFLLPAAPREEIEPRLDHYAEVIHAYAAG